MSRNDGYRNTGKQNRRGFTPDIRPDVNAMLDIYCRVNNMNKTHCVNDILENYLIVKFQALRDKL